ncbi:MAG: ABC transporter ATP-binding protein [Burkholderiales bacterium]
MSHEAPPLLTIDDMSLEFRTRSGTVRALDHVSLSIGRGEIVGLVGESGSGKSVLCHALLGLSDRAARITSGRIRFDGIDLRAATERELQDLRGREIGMVFQNPRAALNPIRKIGEQLEDVLARHHAIRSVDLRARAVACLREVAIADPERRFHAYPFELSGGMCQRVMIALAMSSRPRLLIADEPTTGLDVTTQAAVLELIRERARADRVAALLITHDLALAADFCDRIVVMHAGHVVEAGATARLFASPRHPYTRALIGSTPAGRASLDELQPIAGGLPDLRRADLPPCRYIERCPNALEACSSAIRHVRVDATEDFACANPLPPG